MGDLPIELQAKLLRVLPDRAFARLGASKTGTVNTRVSAATNRDLDALIERGTLQPDRYDRLGVFPIRISPCANVAVTSPCSSDTLSRGCNPVSAADSNPSRLSALKPRFATNNL